MKRLKTIGIILVAAIAVLAIVPFFVTLNDYIPAIESEMSARVGEPVSIESVHLSFFPVPHARIEGITIGGAEEIQVGKLTFRPDLWSLMRQQKVIRSVDIDDVTLAQGALGAFAALTQGDRGAGNVRVERIHLQNAVIKFEKSAFGPFDIDVKVSGTQEQGHLTLTTRDGALRADLAPQGEHYLLALSAHAWTAPIGPAIRFDALSVRGVVRDKGADLSTVDAKLYGGTVSGKVALGWDKGIEVKGELEVKGVGLREVTALVSPKTHLSGTIDARPVFSAHAATAAELDDDLRLETPFTVHDGVLHGFDLMSAAMNHGKSESDQGETRFIELAGQVRLDHRTYRCSDLRITSGPLVVSGAFTVSPSHALSGKLSANAGALGRTMAIPLVVGGTLDSPAVYPDPRALAGRTAGTALPGPALGTAARAKRGEFVGGLLGDTRKR